MFTTAGQVSRVAVGSEEQRDKGTFAVAAIEFAEPPNKSLLDSMEGMDVPGGHPAGLKFIDWDVKKHFKLFGKKQRGAVAEAGRAAAKVELAGASGSTEPEDRGDSPRGATPRDGRRWIPSPNPTSPSPCVSRGRKRSEQRSARRLRRRLRRRAAEAAAEAEDDLISLGGDESDHFDDDGDKSRSDTPEPRDDDDDVRHIEPEGHRLRDDDDDDDDKEDRRPSNKRVASRSRSASRDRPPPRNARRFSNGGDWNAPRVRAVRTGGGWSRCGAVGRRRRRGNSATIAGIPGARRRRAEGATPAGTTAAGAGDLHRADTRRARLLAITATAGAAVPLPAEAMGQGQGQGRGQGQG